MGCFWLLFGGMFCAAIFGIHSQEGPPVVKGSYKATGEMVETLEDETGLLVQIAFEESYDADTKNAAFNVWVMGKNVTYVENYQTNQTFRYQEGKNCTQMTVEEWIKTISPPALLPYEDTKGVVRFSMKQLFSLDGKYLKEKGLKSVYRGIPAKKWMYELPGYEKNKTGQQRLVTVYAYWSDGSWNTTSNEESVPLGFIVSKMTFQRNTPGLKLHEQFINVYSFVPDAINHKLFEPVQGVICENKAQTLKFPDIRNIQSLAMHSEVIFPDYQQIKYVDTWFDSRNKFLRMDSERIKDEVPEYNSKERKFQSEIVIGKMGIVYQQGFYKGKSSCTVKEIKDYELDIQNLFNFKTDSIIWNIGKMFGVNETTYTYIGKTSKRDIPCHLFQGVRTDWPEPALKVKSLWEWCFSVNLTTKDENVIFRSGEYGLINVQVSILSSESPGDIPPEFKIFHHFYDVTLKSSDLMSATDFDIGNCFAENEKRRLQFSVDWAITDDSLPMIENATSDLNFLQKWKTAIYYNSGLSPYSLRISDLQSMVLNKKLLVKFTILAPHKDLPLEIKKLEKSAFDAENTLRDNIKEGKVKVSYIPSKKEVYNVGVIPGSLQMQLNRTFQPHVLSSTAPSTSSTDNKFPFSLVTEPDDDRSSFSPTSGVSVTGTGSVETTTTHQGSTDGSTPKPTKKTLNRDGKVLHQGGTVVAVSITMLIIGISIGSAGVYVKFNGLPPFLKSSGSAHV